ncbi:MAG: hypothetical protein ACD_58C00034G0002 [uncultured bacterium]|nr:MAG: hypothetical protein ACD_58C00034G0002 [uncultured bacterium]
MSISEENFKDFSLLEQMKCLVKASLIALDFRFLETEIQVIIAEAFGFLHNYLAEEGTPHFEGKGFTLRCGQFTDNMEYYQKFLEYFGDEEAKKFFANETEEISIIPNKGYYLVFKVQIFDGEERKNIWRYMQIISQITDLNLTHTYKYDLAKQWFEVIFFIHQNNHNEQMSWRAE